MIDRSEIWVRFATAALQSLLVGYGVLPANGDGIEEHARNLASAAAAYASAMTLAYDEAQAGEPKQLAQPKRTTKQKGGKQP